MAKQKNSDLMVRIIKDSAVWQYLPDPNTIITDFGSNLLIYDKMKLDSRIGSLFDDRRNATHNLGISITTPEDESVAEYAAKYLTEANLRKWGFFLLDGALTYGFRPAEIVWKEDQDGYMFIDGLIGHDICRYRYTQEGQLYYGTHECSEDYRWITHACEGDSLNRPYGRAYLKRVYWAWRFKKLGWEFWMSATEKFAIPSLIALFDQSDPDKAQAVANNLAELIRQVSSGSGGALANIKGIQQISMGGSVSDFNALITACDLQIAYGMTGQALATNVSDTGTQALGTVQERTKASAYENDARALAYTLNKLISMAIEINFGADAEKPVISFDTEDYASFSEVMQAYQQGIPVSKKALYSRYGLPEPEDDDDAITYTPQAQPFGFEFSDEGKKKLPTILIRS